MSLQSVHSTSVSYLYVTASCLDDSLYQPSDNLLLRFTKENCRVHLFEATSFICDIKIGLKFDIQACLDSMGRWKVQVLTLNKEELLEFDVIVYPHKIY